jgi:hypothetical protein
MKRFVTTAVIMAALTLPALAEGDDSSAKAGDAKGTVKSDTNMNAEQPGGTMGRTRATTGSAVSPQQQEQLKSTTGSDSGVSGGKGEGGGSGSGGGPGGSGK